MLIAFCVNSNKKWMFFCNVEPTSEVLNYFRDTQIISIIVGNNRAIYQVMVRPTLSILNSKTILFFHSENVQIIIYRKLVMIKLVT